jgi:hypothetical protein
MSTSRTVRIAVLAGSAGLLASGLVATPSWAEEISCTGPLGAITVDNVRVPQNATCTLNGTVVQGTITVQAGAWLSATGVRVIGNVQAENAASVTVGGSSVGGSVQVKQGASASVTGSTITGDIQYDQNGGGLAADDNRVGGNIQIVGNRGGAQVNRNTINGNLQCKENTPAPTGAGNVVDGSIEDQCRQMAPTTTPTVPGATPRPPVAAAPTAIVKVKSVSRRGKLHVNVNPNKGAGYWTFRVQRLKKDGTWGTYAKTYRTSGRSETRTLNFKKGTYRVLVNPKYGHQGVTSVPVALRR